MSENHADFRKEKHPMYGRHHSDEAKRKMRDAKVGRHTGYDSTSGKRVLQIKNGEVVREWGSMKQAGKALGIDNSGIAKACKGIQKSAGGFQWRYS